MIDNVFQLSQPTKSLTDENRPTTARQRDDRQHDRQRRLMRRIGDNDRWGRRSMTTTDRILRGDFSGSVQSRTTMASDDENDRQRWPTRTTDRHLSRNSIQASVSPRVDSLRVMNAFVCYVCACSIQKLIRISCLPFVFACVSLLFSLVFCFCVPLFSLAVACACLCVCLCFASFLLVLLCFASYPWWPAQTPSLP